MVNSQNLLVTQYLFDWKTNSKFTLTVNLNVLDAELSKISTLPAGTKATDNDNIIFEILDPSGSTLGKEAITLANVGDRSVSINFPTLNNLPQGNYLVKLKWSKINVGEVVFNQNINVLDPAACQPIQVDLKTTTFEERPGTDLFRAIKRRRIDFTNLKDFVNTVLCKEVKNYGPHGIDFTQEMREKVKNRLPFVNVDEYSLIKYAIDAYLRTALKLKDNTGSYSLSPLPYYQNLNTPLEELATHYLPGGDDCDTRKSDRLNGFLAIELIWSYWTEQAMLVQALGAICLRYQNIRGLHYTEPMMRFDTSPLLPLSNFIWGFVQDESHRTTLSRRSFEYQHAYNTHLIGKAVPPQIGVDNRSHFLATFHGLLHQASLFFKEYDDKTRQPDPFPLLIAIRDVHLLLAEGNHNAYYNMTYTTRHEMLTMQYLLSQPEMQTFLGGRPMMPYEPHVGVLDTVKTIQGWDPVGTIHYYELAEAGEQILLSLRYGNWMDSTDMFNAATAGNWALEFRDLISIYINAYRNVTTVDLSSDSSRTEDRSLQPAYLIKRRMAMTTSRRSATAAKSAAAY